MYNSFHSVIYVARGHTQYCGLVRGQQVQNNIKCILYRLNYCVYRFTVYTNFTNVTAGRTVQKGRLQVMRPMT